MPGTNSRQKILNYVKRNRTVTARDVARALQMTPANARHHLGILEADGRVEVVRRQGAGRGRPEKVYRLSGALVGDNLSMLVDALLTEAGGKVRMEALGERMAGDSHSDDRSWMQRLAKVVERLNRMHYQSRWEAGAEGPRIVLGVCPYAAVIEKHPGLCRMDTAMLSQMAGQPVEQISKMERGGPPYCVFAIVQG